MHLDPLIAVYAFPLVALWLAWVLPGKIRSRRNRAILADNERSGLTEPPSLHPVIDPARCLGCASCVKACPEKSVLGIIDGKAALIEPTMCVGHGACQSACPTDAISLVFGTATRGIDIPILSPRFETSVPGIFIAGELGGMGLIKNAIEQGRQAIEFAAAHARSVSSGDGVLDVLIVGCGPAGIAASLGAMKRNLKFQTVDQSTLGGTVAHFPRGKLVMTAPAALPLVGEVKFGEISKEDLLGFWQKVIAETGLEPSFEERVISVTRNGALFDIVTARGEYRSKSVLLAIGRRGTPRTLDVPGEELGKVVYRLADAEQYAGRRVLIVGGGDSALEAAVQLAGQPNTAVTLSYRGSAYSRARAKNREAVARLVAAGAIEELLESTVDCIERQSVKIKIGDELRTIANDDVLVCVGGILPAQFLHNTGILVETKYGTA